MPIDRRKYLAVLMILIGSLYCCIPSTLFAQRVPHIAHVQPDAAGPGMTVALEILSHVDSLGAFGPDGIAPAGLKIELQNPAFDTERVIVGIPVVSWSGRMIQVPILVRLSAIPHSVPVYFRIVRGNLRSNIDSFMIVQPNKAISVNGVILIGEPGNDEFQLTNRNTFVVKSMSVTGAIGNQGGIYFNILDPHPDTPGNPRLLPVTILSEGPVRLTNVDIHLEGSKDGSPGGGGGGSGNEGAGGPGFTGGGSTGSYDSSNVGSGGDPTDFEGGASITGVKGGGSILGDQGGGGGTGHPFGTSGSAGSELDDSKIGGFGGGSAGGESTPERVPFGGGGGGFATDGIKGVGDGDNQGKRTGGRFLLPLAGGSGGGAGNTQFDLIMPAGSGGGGGGALALVSFDSVILTNTNIIATGDSGRVGIPKTGSGGGGSGGAFVVSSNTSVKANGLTVNVNGGEGGRANIEGNAGGNGAPGIARLDGLDTCFNCTLPATHLKSLSQQRIRTRPFSRFIEVSGFAGEGDTFDNDIRIYYRNYHTAWTQVDTVRFTNARGRSVWKKSIPALNDSLLFVIVYQKVKDPRTARQDNEPQWMTTHVAHQIVKQDSRAEYSSADTLFFPDTKTGACSDRQLRISNLGQLPLIITGITGNTEFTPGTFSDPILGYSSGDITFTYCPQAAGCDTLKVTIQTNDGPHDVYLVGCGVDRDERVVINPDPVTFGRVNVGDCDSSRVITVTSTGDDEVVINFADIVQPPFRLDTVGKKSKLKQGEFETFTVHFCPTDSGDFSKLFELIGVNESFTALGTGVIRSLEKRDTVLNEDVCFNYVTLVEDTIFNRGNDPITITRVEISSADIESDLTNPPVTINPGTFYVIRYEIRPSGPGVYSHKAIYYEGDDSLAQAIFKLTVSKRTVNASSEPLYSCASNTIEGSLTIFSESSKAVTITPSLTSEKFVLLGSNPFSLVPDLQHKLEYRFVPSNEEGIFIDTIELLVSMPGCSDTVYKITIRGESTVSPLVISALELSFDSTTIDECIKDSIKVSNVCGPEVILSSMGFASEGFTTTFIDDTIATGESAWIIYEFCPSEVGIVADSHTISAKTDAGILDPIVISLSGIGKQDDKLPVATLNMTSAQTMLGTETTTAVALNELIGVDKINDITFSITYNSDVVWYVSASPHPERSGPLPEIEATNGKITVTYRNASLSAGNLLTLTWLGLLASKAESPLILTIDSQSVSPQTKISVNSGTISLFDCIGFAGGVIPAGQFAMGNVHPQPVGAELLLPVRSGVAATGTLTIKDLSGRTVLQWSRPFIEGDQLVNLPAGDLPAGAYWLELDLVGFRQIRSFWK